MKKKTLQIVIAVVLMCCLFLFPIAGSIYTYNVPKRYQSSVLIDVPWQSSMHFRDVNNDNKVNNIIKANILKGTNVVQAMFEKMNVRGNVKEIPNTVLLQILVEDTNPKRAADIANAAAVEMLANMPAKGENALPTPAKIWAAKIYARAKPPTAPSFPDIPLNTMVSFIAGIICAVCGGILLFFAMKKEEPPLFPIS